MASPLLLSLITGSFPPLFLESSMYTAWLDTLIVYTSGQHATHHLYTSTCQLYMVSILVNAISHVNLPVSFFSLRHMYPPCLPTQSPSPGIYIQYVHCIWPRFQPTPPPIIYLTFLPGNVLSSLTLFVQIRKLIRRKHTLPSCKRRCVLS